jgi:hypothetical protein
VFTVATDPRLGGTVSIAANIVGCTAVGEPVLGSAAFATRRRKARGR